mmetsp:Transcript_20415/g.51880  ORF Transcript_20415/g.51880 Transcript_20415/m.51880 type:complete len:276 (+) Transcript_20415:919-1746(+)
MVQCARSACRSSSQTQTQALRRSSFGSCFQSRPFAGRHQHAPPPPLPPPRLGSNYRPRTLGPSACPRLRVAAASDPLRLARQSIPKVPCGHSRSNGQTPTPSGCAAPQTEVPRPRPRPRPHTRHPRLRYAAHHSHEPAAFHRILTPAHHHHHHRLRRDRRLHTHRPPPRWRAAASPRERFRSARRSSALPAPSRSSPCHRQGPTRRPVSTARPAPPRSACAPPRRRFLGRRPRRHRRRPRQRRRSVRRRGGHSPRPHPSQTRCRGCRPAPRAPPS